ncbi:deoxyribonuclease V [Olivibacter ginsenosidimutans]|uniref:Endonuclease V n=1 Tax=Olivibacter ginsenosidimutans TaxID=1176537 RepID=A0ABP9BFI6_9SPHI
MDISPNAYDTLKIPEATVVQRNLRNSLTQIPLKRPPITIGGADISLNRFSEIIYAGIVVLDYETLQPLHYALVQGKASFPYVPGYLAFREVPALIEAIQLLKEKPDVLMVDGHGIAHPRRMGIAAHLGALIDIPTMGCAKKKLYGNYEEPSPTKGDFSALLAADGERLGYVLRTKNKVKPVYISPGNHIDLADCLRIAQHCIGNYRIPEPTRRAHEFVNLFRTGKLSAGYHERPKDTLF